MAEQSPSLPPRLPDRGRPVPPKRGAVNGPPVPVRGSGNTPLTPGGARRPVRPPASPVVQSGDGGGSLTLSGSSLPVPPPRSPRSQRRSPQGSPREDRPALALGELPPAGMSPSGGGLSPRSNGSRTPSPRLSPRHSPSVSPRTSPRGAAPLPGMVQAGGAPPRRRPFGGRRGIASMLIPPEEILAEVQRAQEEMELESSGGGPGGAWAASPGAPGAQAESPVSFGRSRAGGAGWGAAPIVNTSAVGAGGARPLPGRAGRGAPPPAVKGTPPRPPPPAVRGAPPRPRGGGGRGAVRPAQAVPAPVSDVKVPPVHPKRNLTNSSYDLLIDLVIATDRGLLNALCDTLLRTEVDTIAPALINVFSASNCMTTLLYGVIAREVGQTEHEGTLFRGNTMATKVLSVYGIMAAQEYLVSVLGGPMQYLLDHPELGYEVNPAKAAPGTDVEKNLENLRALTQSFFDSVTSSVESAPPVLRLICRFLRQEVRQKYPEAEDIAVGGFYFLRLLCPALVSPDGFGVVDSLQPCFRRPLVLCSKVLQNLANGVEFGSKEAFMIPLNSFLQENKARLSRFFEDLGGTSAIAPAVQETDVPLDLKNVERLHALFHQRIEQLAQHLASSSTQPALQRFLDVMAKLGTPAMLQAEAQGKKKKKKK